MFISSFIAKPETFGIVGVLFRNFVHCVLEVIVSVAVEVPL